jgi:hypothetical protein
MIHIRGPLSAGQSSLGRAGQQLHQKYKEFPAVNATFVKSQPTANKKPRLNSKKNLGELHYVRDLLHQRDGEETSQM